LTLGTTKTGPKDPLSSHHSPKQGEKPKIVYYGKVKETHKKVKRENAKRGDNR